MRINGVGGPATANRARSNRPPGHLPGIGGDSSLNCLPFQKYVIQYLKGENSTSSSPSQDRSPRAGMIHPKSQLLRGRMIERRAQFSPWRRNGRLVPPSGRRVDRAAAASVWKSGWISSLRYPLHREGGREEERRRRRDDPAL